jgi:hypothetical protein
MTEAPVPPPNEPPPAAPAGGYWYQPPALWVPTSGTPGQPAQPGAREPGNGSAVASIITSCCALALLFLSAGIAAPLTVIASAVGMFLGHKGKNDVDLGKTQVQRDVAVAGFWTGLAGVVLAVISILIWIAIIAIAIADSSNDSFGEFHRQFEWQ